MTKAPTDLRSFDALVEIVAHLRGPNGCPWDKEQTHHSLAPFAIEEVHEMVEAIESGNDPSLKDELGDVLFQVILHSQLGLERQAFGIADIIENLNTKMIRRHPHVFGEETVQNSKEVLANWEIIKKNEKSPGKETSPRGFQIPLHLPSLQRAYKIGSKCHRTGFDWKGPTEVCEKVKEELAEVQEAILKGDQKHIAEELGDLLFAVSQFTRHLGHEPETCLRLANNKFERRYFDMIDLCRNRGWNFEDLSSDEKESLWQEVKRQEATTKKNPS